MIGYVFEVENKENNKKYIGKYFSVRFDAKYLGDNPGVLADVEKFGADKFTVKMLRAAETVQECEVAYNAFLEDAKALTDSNYYNCEKAVKTEPTEVEEEKPKKRTRKKKVIEE